MDLKNKNAVVLGVADESSIAWAIARRLLENGANVHIGYQQKFFSRVRLLMQQYPQVGGARCDILNDEELAQFFAGLPDGRVDILVHGIAFGPAEVFTSPPSAVTAEAFGTTLNISTHSFLKVAGAAKPYLSDWASIMTLTYQASEQASPFYGMMGVAKAALESCVRYLAIEMGQQRVRVNAISPGPIETPAALGEMLAFLRDPAALDTPAGAVLRGAVAALQNDPAMAGEPDHVKAKALWNTVQTRVASECALQEFITQDDVGDCALFLASDLSRKITGQIIRIDGGMSTSRLMPASGEVAAPRPAPSAPEKEAAAPDVGFVAQWLAAQFEGYRVTMTRDDDASYFLVDGDNLHASLCISREFVGQDPAVVIDSLNQWGVAEVLREANGTPVVAVTEGLRFALPDAAQPMTGWCAQSLISPEIDWHSGWLFQFASEADCAAFCERAAGLHDGAVQAVADGQQANVAAARYAMLDAVRLAERDFGARVPHPPVARLCW